MTTIVAQIAPQRSTQYTEFVRDLAPHEIMLSPVGSQITDDVTTIKLGTQDYLKFDLDDNDLSDAATLRALGHLAMTDAYFHYYERIGTEDGPFLKPIDVPLPDFLPQTIISSRRYRGKTHELLTQFMCNLARYSSDYHDTPWNKLTLLDPLSGGGTTLFVGLVLGADVAGVEQDKKVIESTVAFLKEFTKGERIPLKFREDRLKNVGKRWFFTVNQAARCVIARGDTSDVRHFVNGLKRPQLIVTDLPYGIQHRDAWGGMLVSALSAWADVMADGGVLVFSWNATRLPREDMIELVHEVSDFTVINEPPYTELAHRVDRVIKQRDIIVARL